MWSRGAAIRPVPAYAVVDPFALEQVELELAVDGTIARDELDRAFERFEATQPFLANEMSRVFSQPLDETALALGYFLTISIWLAFERAMGPRLGIVSSDAVRATLDSMALEEELRAGDAREPIDIDDVVAIEQPAILKFINQHIELALDVTQATAPEGDEYEVDVDDVHLIYRAVLVLVMALSHAVGPVEGSSSCEILA